VGQRLIKLLVQANLPIKGARVGILGLTFKENVPDVRNSRVPDIVAELRQFGIEPLVHDSLADAQEAQQEYGIQLADWQDLSNLDGMELCLLSVIEPTWTCRLSNCSLVCAPVES
jgi:UDP-N-acetyl-D-galactosamine dehydrogenase